MAKKRKRIIIHLCLICCVIVCLMICISVFSSEFNSVKADTVAYVQNDKIDLLKTEKTGTSQENGSQLQLTSWWNCYVATSNRFGFESTSYVDGSVPLNFVMDIRKPQTINNDVALAICSATDDACKNGRNWQMWVGDVHYEDGACSNANGRAYLKKYNQRYGGYETIYSKQDIFEDIDSGRGQIQPRTGLSTLFSNLRLQAGEYILQVEYFICEWATFGWNHKWHWNGTREMNFSVSMNGDVVPKENVNYNISPTLQKVDDVYYVTKQTTATNLFEFTSRKPGTAFVVNGSRISDDSVKKTKLTQNFSNTVYAENYLQNAGKKYTVVYDTLRPNLENLTDVKTWFSLDEETIEKLNNKSLTSTTAINLGKTNAKAKFNFETTNVESRESATYDFTPYVQDDFGKIMPGETIQNLPYASGAELIKEGIYKMTIQDLAGNKLVFEFELKQKVSSENFKKITERSYLKSGLFEVKLPNGYSKVDLTGLSKLIGYENAYKSIYSNSKSYLLADIEKAKKFAFDCEVEQNLIKTETGYIYKKIGNSNNFEFQNENGKPANELIKSLEYYSQRFVFQKTPQKNGENVYINPNVILLESDCLGNTVSIDGTKFFFIQKDFVFKKTEWGTQSFEIFDYITNQKFEIDSATAKLPFSEIVRKQQGAYRVIEKDGYSNVLEYYIYLDLSAPVVNAIINDGSQDKSVTITDQTKKVFYLNTFDFESVLDNIDEVSIVQIKCSDSQIAGIYTPFSVPKLVGTENGGGVYNITIYDRSSNSFNFDVTLLGNAPKTTFRTSGSGVEKTMIASISKGETFNIITSIKCYRNGTLLQNGYKEFETSEPMNFDPATTTYEFKKGGHYYFEITDNFNRTTLSQFYKFEQGLPEVKLTGVQENGTTRQNVQVEFSSEFNFAVYFQNGLAQIEGYKIQQDTILKKTVIFFEASEKATGTWKVVVCSKIDLDNYNEVVFKIKASTPKFEVLTVDCEKIENGEVITTGAVIVWNVEEQISSVFVQNGNFFGERYKQGEVISKSGDYKITVTDKFGNKSSFDFVVDKEVKFKVVVNNNKNAKLSDTHKIIDGLSVKTCKDNFLIEAMEANLKISGVQFNQLISNTGFYKIKISDSYGNSETIIIEIDKVAPNFVATIKNSSKTNQNVEITFDNIADIELLKVYFNNKLINCETFKTLNFSNHGRYKVEAYDKAENRKTIEFEIDKIVEFEANFVNGAILNGNAKLKLREEMKVFNVYLNDVLIEEFKDFKPAGRYKVEMVDMAKNSKVVEFELVGEIVSNKFEFQAPKGFFITKIEKDSKVFDFEINENGIALIEDGFYKIFYLSEESKAEFCLSVQVLTTPPAINLKIGSSPVKFGEKIVSSPKLKFDNDVVVEVYLNGQKINVASNMELNEYGVYKIVAKDRAGNISVMEFEKVWKINFWSILLIFLIVIACGFITYVAMKKRFKKKSKI